MGLLKNIKAIWDPEARIQATLDAQAQSFDDVRRHHPDRDVNAWLAASLQARPAKWHEGWNEGAYYTAMAPLTLLPASSATAALGYYILQREDPAVQPLFVVRQSQILKILDTLSPDDAAQKWKRENPWTARVFPGIAETLVDMMLEGVPGLTIATLR